MRYAPPKRPHAGIMFFINSQVITGSSFNLAAYADLGLLLTSLGCSVGRGSEVASSFRLLRLRFSLKKKKTNVNFSNFEI